MKETFLRAADIVEEMGLTMETLDDIDDISTNGTFSSQSTLQRNKRSLQLNMTDLGSQETSLVKNLAEKMRVMPITNVRRIRSGVKSILKYYALKDKCIDSFFGLSRSLNSPLISIQSSRRRIECRKTRN